jgi:hypothetical protein
MLAMRMSFESRQTVRPASTVDAAARHVISAMVLAGAYKRRPAETPVVVCISG